MQMDVSLGAVLGAAPTPDAQADAAETPANASDAFAALLDEAASATGEPEVTEAEDDFDELAALAMASLLTLGVPVPPAPTTDAVSDEDLAATDITDQAVVTDLTDLTDRATIADITMPSQLTATIGNDMGLEASEDLAMIDVAPLPSPAAEPTEVPTGEVASTGKNATIDAVETPQAAPKSGPTSGPTSAPKSGPTSESKAAVAAAVIDATTTEGDVPRSEIEATTEKADADVKTVLKGDRSSKPSHSAHASAPHKNEAIDHRVVQRASSEAAEQKAEEAPGTTRAQQVTDVRGSGSTAARFARALERAAALPSGEPSGETAATNTNTRGSGQQSGFGESATSRAAQLTAAIKQSMPGAVAFTVNTTAPIETRARAAAAANVAGVAIDTAPMTIPERDVVAQLVQSLRVQFRDGIGEAVVKLKPEHLGSVQISLRVENGALKATVQAEAPAVRQWLESQQDTLRTSLADHGLRLERFVVEPEGEPTHTTDDARHQQQREREQRRRHPQRRMSETDQPLFEVTV
jgi:flagellar hook-length control protein FliK